MRYAMIVGVTALLMIVFVPIMLLVPLSVSEKETTVIIIDPPKSQQNSVLVKVGTEKGILEMDLEEYVTGVVVSEMPASFEKEALKAQAVAARTFAWKQISGGKHDGFDVCGNSACCQAWISMEDLCEKVGNTAENIWSNAEIAVQETRGQVLTYHGSLVEAVYFSCSGGSTEDAVAVWGSDVPYLQSVVSVGEEAASVYHSTIRLSTAEFQSKLKEHRPDIVLQGSPDQWIGACVLTEGLGVDCIEIGDGEISGTELRKIFELNSTKFTADVENDQIVFRVMGYGHRVGMSQYGANAMAKTGKNYMEILQHYYSGVQIETKNP